MRYFDQKKQPNTESPQEGLPSPYEPTETADADLWFLPHYDDEAEAGEIVSPPLPRADQRRLFDPVEWGRAQADLSDALAALCFQFGVLDERLSHMAEGACQRLAIREAAEVSWWVGSRITVERLTLWVAQRTGGGLDDSQALVQAGWAVRRLRAGQGPWAEDWPSGTAAFLGHNAETDAAAELAEVMTAAAHLHPVTQSAVLFHAWRMVGQGAARDTEAAVMAACHAASMGRGAARFLPLSMAGGTALQSSGSAHARLASWISGAEKAVLLALMQLARLSLWQDAAMAALTDRSGRTPGLLVNLLAAWPMVSAPMAEAQTGASRAAVQRNLDLLAARGLIREITGQGRFRVWTAAV